jgi:uncharacterized protein (DUF983 family)
VGYLLVLSLTFALVLIGAAVALAYLTFRLTGHASDWVLAPAILIAAVLAVQAAKGYDCAGD